MGKCYKTFYSGSLLPFQGNHQGNITLYYRMMVLPWNSGK